MQTNNILYVLFFLVAISIAVYVIKMDMIAQSKRIDKIELRIKQMEADIKKAHHQAMWAQTLLIDNMDSVGKEIRTINKELGMTPWRWGAR